MLAGVAQAAVPTHFETVFGSALLCRDQVDPIYFAAYLKQYFGPSVRTEGQAYWYKIDAGLFDVPVKEAFVSIPGARFDFIGIVIDTEIEDARTRVQKYTGETYYPDPFQKTSRTPAGSILINYGAKQSKIYCVKYPAQSFR